MVAVSCLMGIMYTKSTMVTDVLLHTMLGGHVHAHTHTHTHTHTHNYS